LSPSVILLFLKVACPICSDERTESGFSAWRIRSREDHHAHRWKIDGHSRPGVNPFHRDDLVYWWVPQLVG
jgi:hypothetical protein